MPCTKSADGRKEEKKEKEKKDGLVKVGRNE